MSCMRKLRNRRYVSELFVIRLAGRPRGFPLTGEVASFAQIKEVQQSMFYGRPWPGQVECRHLHAVTLDDIACVDFLLNLRIEQNSFHRFESGIPPCRVL